MGINRKFVIAGAAVAALTAAGAFAIADTRHGPRGQGMGHGMGHGMGQGMGMGNGGMGMGGQRAAGMGMQDPAERLATVKSELAIKPEQTAAWDAYAKIVTETAAERRKVREGIDRDAVHAMKPEDRQAFRDSMMKQRDEAQAKVKSAAETLLAVLDEAQKVKARTSLPGLADAGHGRGAQHSMAGGGRGHGGGGHGMGHGDGKGPRRNN